MVSVVVFEFRVMRCQPLRRALCIIVVLGECKCLQLCFLNKNYIRLTMKAEPINHKTPQILSYSELALSVTTKFF
ncbi:hypothetical protein I7101_004024 [Vibrio cholerae]|nr:hypothetical protein [Vibrio cholerae]